MNNIPENVVVFYHAIRTEFPEVQMQRLTRRNKGIKDEYLFTTHKGSCMIWQTHSGLWYWSDPNQTMMNMNYVPSSYEKEIKG